MGDNLQDRANRTIIVAGRVALIWIIVVVGVPLACALLIAVVRGCA